MRTAAGASLFLPLLATFSSSATASRIWGGFQETGASLVSQGVGEKKRTKDELKSEVETRYASHQSLLKTNNRANDRKLRWMPHSVCVYAQTGNQYVKGQYAFLLQKFSLAPQGSKIKSKP